MNTVNVGDRVVFQKKVYKKPFKPLFDGYKGHVFEVVEFKQNPSSIELKCVSKPEITVDPYIFDDYIQPLQDEFNHLAGILKLLEQPVNEKSLHIYKSLNLTDDQIEKVRKTYNSIVNERINVLLDFKK